MNKLKIWAAAAALLAFSAAGARATISYDMNTTYNFLKAYDGSQGSGLQYPCATGDLNGDGIDDVVTVEASTGTNGRSANGAVYVLYGLHKTTGTIVQKLGDNYNVRFVGANSNDNLNNCYVGDYNADGQDDLMLVAGGAAVNYIVYGPLPSGTLISNDLATASNFNLKYVMASGNGLLYPFLADLNGDGVDDLFLEAPDYGSTVGGVFVLYGPQPTVTGAIKDLSVATNYNLFIYGTAGSTYLLNTARWGVTNPPVTSVGDLNGDGAPDIVFNGCGNGSWGRSQNGTVYVSTGPFPTGTGNVWYTSDGGRYMLKIAGESNNACLSRSVIADFNGDGYNDLCMAATYGDYVRGDNGTVYCVYGPLNYNLNTQLDMAVSNNYNVLFYGQSASDNVGYAGIRAADLNGDGIKDLVIESEWANTGGTSDTGALYVINGGSTTFFKPGTGWTYDLNSATSYNFVIYDSQYVSHMTQVPSLFKDMDGDGYLDIVTIGEGYYNTASCGNGTGILAIYYGPTPNTTGSASNIASASGGDQRFYYSNCNFYYQNVNLTGDFDGDGFQDVTLNWRYFDGQGLTDNGRLWLVSTSTGMARVNQPVLFTSSGVSNNLTISWSAVSAATQYRMQLDVDPRFPSPTSDQTVAVTNAVVTGLTNGQTYYVRVKPTNGNLVRWGPVSTFTVDNTAPVAPTLITPPDQSSVGTQTPAFDWSDASTE